MTSKKAIVDEKSPKFLAKKLPRFFFRNSGKLVAGPSVVMDVPNLACWGEQLIFNDAGLSFWSMS